MKILEKIKQAKKVHILGVAGQEGRAVFDYLLSLDIDIVGHVSVKQEDFKNTFASFADAYSEEETRNMTEKFLSSGKMVFGDDYAKGIKAGDIVIAPQAYRRLALNASIIEMREKQEITLIQAIELAFEITNSKTIGVAGTAGKSTATALIGNILQTAGVPFYFSGNDRDNKWDFFALEALPKNGYALFEISHRHLMDLKQSPHIAVLTSLFPHHLDDAGGSYENYIKIETSIYRFQTEKDIAIINRSLFEDETIKKTEEIRGKLLTYGGDILEAEYNGRFAKIALSDFKLPGKHNIQNALGAMYAGLVAGLPVSAVEDGIKNFHGLKYRQEFIGEYNGVKIINDGKSSDPLTVVEAVKAIPNIVALIVGGIREGFLEGDFLLLGETVIKYGVKKVLVFGSSKKEIVNDLAATGVSAELCLDLQDAVIKAKALAKTGETIVFSPGCQSFDEFKDYRHKASTFNSLVQQIFSSIDS